jgi:integrin-linked kinase-associated serine/threonine phosphatase 2C
VLLFLRSEKVPSGHHFFFFAGLVLESPSFAAVSFSLLSFIFVLDTRISFYSVYDGHGGKQAALLAEEYLHKFFIEDEEFKKGNIPKALRSAYKRTDKLILERSKAEEFASGTTAVTVVLHERKLYVANVGDSEAVVGRRRGENSGTWDPILLSQRHTPNEEKEKERLSKLGCAVTQGRVCGVLAVSRSLGDCEFKSPQNQQPHDFVISDPFVASMDLTDLDDFIVIACDGLWDTLNYHDAVEIVASARWNQKSANQAADALVKEALDRRTMDNVTCIVVYLQPPVNPKEKKSSDSSIKSNGKHSSAAEKPAGPLEPNLVEYQD